MRSAVLNACKAPFEDRNSVNRKPLLRELFFIFVGCIGLIIHCVIRSPRKLFWTDEILTWLPCNSSFSELIDSLQDTINAMPPTYFVGVWSWSTVFGSSPMSLRLYSSCWMAVSWVFAYLLLRRFTTPLISFTSITVAISFSHLALIHNVEARCYSMHMACFFAASYFLILACSPTVAHRSLLWVGVVAAHALLVTTHYLGFIYSGGLVVCAIILSRTLNNHSIKYYILYSIIGASFIWICIPFYLAQRDLGGKDNWLTTPSLMNLLTLYTFQMGKKVWALVAVIGFSILTMRIELIASKRGGHNSKVGQSTLNEQRSVFAICLITILIPLAIWIESQLGIKLFLDRYLLPSLLLLPLLLSAVLSYLHSCSKQFAFPSETLFGRFTTRSSQVCCSTLLVLSLGMLARDCLSWKTSLTRIEHIVATSNQLGVELYSTDLNCVMPCRFYGSRSQFVTLEQFNSPQIELRQPGSMRTTAEALERRYWGSFVIQPTDFADGEWTFLIRSHEWREWSNLGIIPTDWRVVSRRGSLLVISNVDPVH